MQVPRAQRLIDDGNPRADRFLRAAIQRSLGAIARERMFDEALVEGHAQALPDVRVHDLGGVPEVGWRVLGVEEAGLVGGVCLVEERPEIGFPGGDGGEGDRGRRAGAFLGLGQAVQHDRDGAVGDVLEALGGVERAGRGPGGGDMGP